jgi:acetyl esterase/lipase
VRPLRRALHLLASVASSLAVRVLVRTRPQRWCPPAISLRLFRLSSAPGTALVTADLRRHLPAGDRTVRRDLSYAPGGRETRFDLVLPPGEGPHPLVVWFHGGGWHFGDKGDVLPYLEHLADRGFAGAAVNYPLAPRAAYPAAPEHAGRALRHLAEHAASYGIDPTRIVVAGDSAGAQVAAELAVRVSTEGSLPLRGAVFFCGIFDPPGLADANRMFEAALESAMWSLTGSRSWEQTEPCRRMTIVDQVTPAFPPTFLGSGVQDPLTRRQTPPMAARLRELGVDVDELTVGTEDAPMHHQFQFWLGTPQAQEALERVVAFLRRVTGESPSISH